MHLRHTIVNNLPWKLGAILIAVVIYSTIDANLQGSRLMLLFRAPGTQTARFDVPVTVNTRSTDERVFVLTPPEVEVTLRGSQSALDSLKKSDVKAFVDLDGAPNSGSFRTRVNVYVPPTVGAGAIAVLPAELMVERKVPPEVVNPEDNLP